MHNMNFCGILLDIEAKVQTYFALLLCTNVFLCSAGSIMECFSLLFEWVKEFLNAFHDEGNMFVCFTGLACSFFCCVNCELEGTQSCITNVLKGYEQMLFIYCLLMLTAVDTVFYSSVFGLRNR